MQNNNSLSIILLAAGFGSRFKPVTRYLPKPLICVCGQSLIMRHIESLRFLKHQFVINIAYHANAFIAALGHQDVEIDFVYEITPQGVSQSLKSLASFVQSQQFLVVSSDLYITDYDQIEQIARRRCQAVIVDRTSDYAGVALLNRELLLTQDFSCFAEIFNLLKANGAVYRDKGNIFNVTNQEVANNIENRLILK